MSLFENQTAALYVRLSQEDRNKINKEDESESITNQQTILLEYCKKNGFDVYDIYSDENWSGSDRERPEFNRMIADAREKKFNTIICKTQSRFARDMEMIEKYINGLFLIWGIRFISVVDNGDSMNKANRKTRQIFALTDQWYLEDLSDNIRATLSSKRKQGLWVGAFAPYGYMKDPADKNHLIVDDEAAEIVRYVFDLYLKGYGITPIARKLNEEHIPNPATYKKQHGQPFQNINKECSDMWHTYSVQRMLSNEIYIGNMVQGTQENISYKSTKKRQKPKDEWDVVEGTHEAIIDLDTWNKVQKLRGGKPKSEVKGKPNPLAKKVRCMDCGGSMRVSYHNHKRYFRCNTYYMDKSRCKGMTISEKVLHAEIIKQIHALYKQYADNAMIADSLEIENEYRVKIKLLSSKIKNSESEIEKLDKRLSTIYIDKLDGVISVDEFVSLKTRFSGERDKLIDNVTAWKAEIDKINEKIALAKNRFEIIEQFKDVKELDYLTAQTLIDYVEIGGNQYDRVINIYWNF